MRKWESFSVVEKEKSMISNHAVNGVESDFPIQQNWIKWRKREKRRVTAFLLDLNIFKEKQFSRGNWLISERLFMKIFNREERKNQSRNLTRA